MSAKDSTHQCDTLASQPRKVVSFSLLILLHFHRICLTMSLHTFNVEKLEKFAGFAHVYLRCGHQNGIQTPAVEGFECFSVLGLTKFVVRM